MNVQHVERPLKMVVCGKACRCLHMFSYVVLWFIVITHVYTPFTLLQESFRSYPPHNTSTFKINLFPAVYASAVISQVFDYLKCLRRMKALPTTHTHTLPQRE